jgi:hypothetical protein
MRIIALLTLSVALIGCQVPEPEAKVDTSHLPPPPGADKPIVEIAQSLLDDPLAAEFKPDPAVPLRRGLAWYRDNVKDYTCTLYKQERLNPDGDFQDQQKILCRHKVEPFSVFCHTVENPRGAVKALYVQGKWDGKMKARTGGLLPMTFSVDPRGGQARANTLKFIDEFGFGNSLASMIAGVDKAAADPRVGLIVKVLANEKVGDREAILLETFIRELSPSGRFENPHLKIWLDRERLVPLQVHTWDENGIARGRYRFVDVKFNVGLTDEQFTPKACGM